MCECLCVNLSAFGSQRLIFQVFRRAFLLRWRWKSEERRHLRRWRRWRLFSLFARRGRLRMPALDVLLEIPHLYGFVGAQRAGVRPLARVGSPVSEDRVTIVRHESAKVAAVGQASVRLPVDLNLLRARRRHPGRRRTREHAHGVLTLRALRRKTSGNERKFCAQ